MERARYGCLLSLAQGLRQRRRARRGLLRVAAPALRGAHGPAAMGVRDQEEATLPPRIRQLRMTAQRAVAGGTLRGRKGHDPKCVPGPRPRRIFSRGRPSRRRYDLSPPEEAGAGLAAVAGLAGAVEVAGAAVEADDDEDDDAPPPPSFLVEP